jgi:hypothetical protein
MPYNNEYNRKIKSQYEDVNRKYIEHQKQYDELFNHTPMVSGLANKNFEGGAIPKFLNSDVDYGVNQGSRVVYGDASQYGSNFGEKDATDDKLNYVENLDKEKPMSGKGGYAEGTFRDTGFERTIGAGKPSKGVRVYKKKVPLKLSKDMNMEGGKMKKMVGGTELGLPQKLVKTGGRKPKCNVCKRVKCKCVHEMKEDMKEDMKPDMIQKVLKKRGRKPKKDMNIENENENLVGKGFLSDLWKGVKKVAKPLASVAKVGLSMVPLPQAQLASTALGALGAGKKRGRPSKMKGGNLVPVANMKSSSMAGQGKPKNKRSEIVKKIMKEKGLSMIEASKYVRLNNLYVK